MLGGAGAGMAAGTDFINGAGGGGVDNKAGAPPGIPPNQAAAAAANGGGSAGATPTLAGLAAAGILYEEELDPSFLQRSISAPPTEHAYSGAERGGGGLDYYYYYQPNNLNPRLPNNGKQQLSPTLAAQQQHHQHQQHQQHMYQQHQHQQHQGAPGLTRDDSALFAHFPQPSKPVSALVGEYLTGLDGSGAAGGAPSASAASGPGNPPSTALGALEAPRPVRTPSLPPGEQLGPSLQDAMKARSLIELIQDDFPRTPSPVFPHGNGAATAASVAQAISLGMGMATAAAQGSHPSSKVSSPVRAYPGARSASVPLVTSAHPHPPPPRGGPTPQHHHVSAAAAASSVDVLASTMQGLGLGLAGNAGGGGPSGAVDDLMLDAAGGGHHQYQQQHHGAGHAHAHAHAHAHHMAGLPPAHHPQHPGHIRAASANDVERHAAAAAAQRAHGGGGVMYQQVHDPSAGGDLSGGLDAAGLGLAGPRGGAGAGGDQVYFRVAQPQGPYGRQQDVVYRVPAEYVTGNGDIRCVLQSV